MDLIPEWKMDNRLGHKKKSPTQKYFQQELENWELVPESISAYIQASLNYTPISGFLPLKRLSKNFI